MKLSALILTANEQEMIGDCLVQLTFVDEIIVLDQNSEDQTVNIAKKYTSQVFKSTHTHFDKNRNLLASMAHGQWLLYIDADERLTPQLVAEIKEAISRHKAECSAFYFPRKNFILGRWAKHGGWWPDYVPRLFKRSTLTGWHGAVHESPQIIGQYGYMSNPIIHLTARSLDQMLQKSIKWAKIEAKLHSKRRQSPVTIFKVIKYSTGQFFYRYIVKLGCLDGILGLINAIYQAIHGAIVMVYLWEIQNDTKRHNLNAKYI